MLHIDMYSMYTIKSEVQVLLVCMVFKMLMVISLHSTLYPIYQRVMIVIQGERERDQTNRAEMGAGDTSAPHASAVHLST